MNTDKKKTKQPRILNMNSIKNMLENSNEPLIFNGFIDDWKILKWSLNDWETKTIDEYFPYRSNGFIKSKTPIWERTCSETRMTMTKFITFQNNANNTSWVYFDYKPMNIYFEESKEILESIQWANFGFPDKDGKDSTIWIGSKGAHTPCHKDTYGYNLIAQVYGRKRWIIFPPEENLQPTRIPFEESSIYSKLNFFYPELNEFKGISNARSVILNPGDVLYLPAGWWHYVENIETAISVNMWIDLPQDNRKRLEEGMVQLFISRVLMESDKKEQNSIVNPNSEFILDNTVKDYLEILKLNIEQYKKENTQNKKPKVENETNSETLTNSPDIKINKENIKIIPKLTQEEFISLLNEQRVKYDFKEEVEDPMKHDRFLENVINAFCNPEIISQIVDKVIKE